MTSAQSADFSHQASAPAVRHSSASSGVSRPDMTTMRARCVSGFDRRRLQTSSPLRPGMFTSSRNTSGLAVWVIIPASKPSAAKCNSASGLAARIVDPRISR